MRDPWGILGVARGAGLDEIKSAFRRKAKQAHPDGGGSSAAFRELKDAYEFVLEDLKRGYREQQRRRQEPPRPEQRREAGQQEASSAPPGDQRRTQPEDEDRLWERYYREIDEELERLRRAAEDYEDRLRSMRAHAWDSGQRAAWLRLTWEDLIRFIRGIVRGGVKGVALLVAALLGVGGILAQINFVSALLVVGSLIGFFVSVALKNDKGGAMSAWLLLFGLMTFWLPPVRAALFGYPITTISVLLCLALVYKFGQQAGVAGLLTGGLLASYVIGAALTHTDRGRVANSPSPVPPPVASVPPKAVRPQPESRTPALVPRVMPLPPTSPTPSPPESRTLLAAEGSMLKFVEGVPYQLKIRGGLKTVLVTVSGRIAFHRGETRVGECLERLELFIETGTSPYREINHTIRSCGPDAVFRVATVN